MKLDLVIYVQELEKMKKFYQYVFGFIVKEVVYSKKSSNHIMLIKDDLELVLIEKNTLSPVSSTLKPIFIIDEPMAVCRKRIKLHGGSFSAKSKEWLSEGFQVCDGVDMEGNVFEVRYKKN